MSNKKKYIITSITLSAISAVAALAIAGTNLITKDIIRQNEEKAQQKALQLVFEDALSFSEKKNDFSVATNKYLVYYCVAYSDENKANELGYVYYTDGRNAYGEIAMMVGITNSGIGDISVVTNTQTFASTLEDNYINPYANRDDGASFEDFDTSCGATYGAELIKGMANQALEDYQVKKGAK